MLEDEIVLDWSGNIPALNPIENLWHILEACSPTLNQSVNVIPVRALKIKQHWPQSFLKRSCLSIGL